MSAITLCALCGSGLQVRTSLLAIGSAAHAHDFVRLAPHAVRARVALLDVIDVLHAFYHAADHGVFSVQERRGAETEEELRIGAVGILRACHAYRAAHERFVGELSGQLDARAAGARAG